jgi:hypothetical protein
MLSGILLYDPAESQIFALLFKEALIKEVLENNVEPKHCKVSRFLKEKYKVTVLVSR